jgi:hypothetical protein
MRRHSDHYRPPVFSFAESRNQSPLFQSAEQPRDARLGGETT